MDTARPGGPRCGGNVNPLRDTGWLVVGGVAAALVAVFGADLLRLLTGVTPIPWGPIVAAVLVFAAFAGLHFRLQLMRSLEQQRDQVERTTAASRLINAASGDGRRWLRVVQENLELVLEDSQPESQRRLYLEGARANADKIEQAFERIEGNQQRLDELDAGTRTEDG